MSSPKSRSAKRAPKGKPKKFKLPASLRPLPKKEREALWAEAAAKVKPGSQKELIPYLGTFENFMTPEELDEMRSGRCKGF